MKNLDSKERGSSVPPRSRSRGTVLVLKQTTEQEISMHALPQTTLACGWRLRLERHLTQQALADLSGVPYNTPTRIEQGRLAATPHAVVILVRAMRVEFSTNVGQPYKDELRADELDVLIAPIREGLEVCDLGADPDISARPLRTLERTPRGCARPSAPKRSRKRPAMSVA
jgi:transcriptional regulator with XRE-family HTH domain